jgi:hypothetical protein
LLIVQPFLIADGQQHGHLTDASDSLWFKYEAQEKANVSACLGLRTECEREEIRNTGASAIDNLRFSIAWLGASFTATFLMCAIAIHGLGYRVIFLPPVRGSATIARHLVRRHPERFAHELEQALRRHRSPAASVQREQGWAVS